VGVVYGVKVNAQRVGGGGNVFFTDDAPKPDELERLLRTYYGASGEAKAERVEEEGRGAAAVVPLQMCVQGGEDAMWRHLEKTSPLPCGWIQVSPTRHTQMAISLYKILFHFKASLWESIILLLPPTPPAKPTLLQYYCTTIAQYTPPHQPPPFYDLHHTILVMAISCKGQGSSHVQVTGAPCAGAQQLQTDQAQRCSAQAHNRRHRSHRRLQNRYGTFQEGSG